MSPGILNDTEYRAFWISWEGHNLTVGSGSRVGENVLVFHHDAAMPTFTATAFDTRDGRIGYWKIKKDRGARHSWAEGSFRMNASHDAFCDPWACRSLHPCGHLTIFALLAIWDATQSPLACTVPPYTAQSSSVYACTTHAHVPTAPEPDADGVVSQCARRS